MFKDRGTWYLAFGSWWEGIHLFELEDMTSVSGEPVQLAEVTGAPSLEGPSIIFRRAGRPSPKTETSTCPGH